MKVHELLAKPENWTKTALARLPNGTPTYPSHPNACCWCLDGAIMKVDAPFHETIKKVYAKINGSIWEWNDTHTHAEVLALCKELDI